MLLIGDDQIKALGNRLTDPKQYQQCMEEIQRMVEIKQTLLWRADTAMACCGWATVMRFTNEVQLLEAVLEAFKEQQIEKASTILEEYRIYLSGQL